MLGNPAKRNKQKVPFVTSLPCRFDDLPCPSMHIWENLSSILPDNVHPLYIQAQPSVRVNACGMQHSTRQTLCPQTSTARSGTVTCSIAMRSLSSCLAWRMPRPTFRLPLGFLRTPPNLLDTCKAQNATMPHTVLSILMLWNKRVDRKTRQLALAQLASGPIKSGHIVFLVIPCPSPPIQVWQDEYLTPGLYVSSAICGLRINGIMHN
jgi:hypothetical protein